MKILKFSVTNYKVFEGEFAIDFFDENITILLGINNVGKSTFLEALNMFFKTEGPTEEDFNINKKGSGESFEFKLNAINNEGNNVELKTSYSDTGKKAQYFVDDEKYSKKDFQDYIQTQLTTPFYVSPDSKAEDNEKAIQKLFQDNAKSFIEDNPKNKSNFDQISDDINKLLIAANKVIQPSIDDLNVNVENDLNRIFGEELGKLNIKINTDKFEIDNYTNLMTSEMQFNKGINEFKLTSQGTGVRRAAFISLLQNAMKEEKLIFKNNHLLLIDEPEVFLHPMAIKELSNILYDIAGEKLQIIISTHSPVFVDLYKGINKSIRVLKLDDKAIQLFSSNKNNFSDNDVENIKLLTLTNPYFNEFFFAKKILIIEGDSEYIIFNECIKHYLKDEGKGKLPIHIINAKGKWTIPSIQKILNEFNANYYVYHDLDTDRISSKNSLEQANNRIKEFAELNKNAYVIANENTLEDTLYNKRVSDSSKTIQAIKLIESVKKSTLKSNDKAINIVYNIIKWIYDEPRTLDEKIHVIK